MIIIQTEIKATIENVWTCWTEPQHIENWNFAGDDWCCPKAIVDLRNGGRFSYTMAARVESFKFDFSGSYEAVESLKLIKVLLDDGRVWITKFEPTENGTRVTESFDPENQNPEELQRTGWQMILDRFKRYVELNV